MAVSYVPKIKNQKSGSKFQVHENRINKLYIYFILDSGKLMDLKILCSVERASELVSGGDALVSD